MEVEYFSYAYVNDQLRQDWLEAISKIVTSGVFIGGKEVDLFEENFSKVIGIGHAIGVSNGFDGLELALRALGIGPGDHVAVPAHTFIATWNAVIACGAIPVGIDVGIDAQIDLENLTDVLKTKDIACVVPVHMHGHMVDMESLQKVCNSFDVSIVEDASQSHLAFRRGISAGTASDVGVFSLYPTKNLGALGDAGVVVTKNENVAERVRKLSNYGSKRREKYIHSELGFNRRLDPLQAAVLNVNIRYLREWNSIRAAHAAEYSSAMNELGIHYLVGHEGSVWHHFCIFVDERDQVRDFLQKNGVSTEVHYPRVAAHEVESFSGITHGNYPIATEISKTILSLPISQFHSKEMVHKVISVLREAKLLGILK